MKINNFGIIDLPGTNTLAFQLERQGEFAFLQKLDYTSKIDEGKNQKEFTILEGDNPKDIVLLTLGSNKAILSVGELRKGELVSKESELPLSYGTVYNTEGVSYKEFAYSPNMKRKFVIIDTNTAEEVKPIVYVDDMTKEIKGKCRILPLRPYVVIETVNSKNKLNVVSERAAIEVFNGKSLETMDHGKLDINIQEKGLTENDISKDESIV